MKLILTGGGDSEHFHEIDSVFINLLPSNSNLLFIPLAGDEEHWHDGLERIKETFSTIEFNHIEMCLDLSSLNWEYLRNFHAIYIDGGNTFELIRHFRKNQTYELLFKFLHHGGVINGDSAGAIILGSHLQTAHFGEMGDENLSEIKSYQGLNLLGPWAIHCHYDEDEDHEIQSFVAEFGYPVLALHENSSVFIENHRVHIFGENKVSIFRPGFQEDILPNQIYTLSF